MAESDAPAQTPPPRQQQENPLMNILINVLIPVVALGVLSKSSGEGLLGFLHLGPVKGMLIAVALPLGYGIWFLIKHRKLNFFSILGVVSILLTGGLTIYLWNEDGTVKANAPMLFALKEAAIPLIFGVTILLSWWSKNPLVKVFLFNPDVFDVPKIEKHVAEKGTQNDFRKLLFEGNLWMGLSFFISTVMNFFLAMHFLSGATGSREAYNAAVGKLTGWGFLVIGLPIMVILVIIMIRLVKKLEAITGLSRDDIIMPR